MRSGKSTAREGGLTPSVKQRFVALVREFEMAGVDAVVCTCSTLSPLVPQVAPLFDVPLVSIDRNMMEQAAKCGGKLLLVATSATAIAPVEAGIRRHNPAAAFEVLHCAEAGEIMRAGGGMGRHDELVLQALEGRRGFGGVVFAQASLAHLQEPAAKQTGCPVFTAPDYCIEELSGVLAGNWQRA